MKKIIVIGGGASGLMAAAAAAGDASVVMLEKNEKVGKKIYITGKGRCNLTNQADVEEMLQEIHGNPYFLYSALYGFDSGTTMNFFESLGVPLKVERGGRVFPVSEKSSDIIKAFKKKLDDDGVDIMFNEEAMELLITDGTVKGVCTGTGKKIYGDAVIVATGGLSYPATGSTGDGYKLAKAAGHKITKLYPSLVPLRVSENWVSDLQGLSLKNIEVCVKSNGKTVFRDFGELLFTHYGVSGPVILSASRYITDKLNMNITIEIDLKPALDEKKLDARILRDFESQKNKALKNSLGALLPQSLIPVIITLSKIDADTKINLITKEDRKALLNTIKRLTVTVTGTAGYGEAVVTMGGINVDEINPSTMESKIVKNLYLAGEVIDVDGFTGGFNLQIAFSTGFLAGKSAAKG